MSEYNKSIVKRTITMVIVSLVLIILNLWFFQSELARDYKKLVPSEPAWLWDMLPLFLANIVAGLVIGKTKKHKLIYAITGSILSVFAVYAYIMISFFFTMKDFN